VLLVKAMLQVVVNNTFVSTIGEEDCRVRLLASPRSKSAELPIRGRWLSDDEAVDAMEESQQIVRLNALPGFCADVRASSHGATHTFRTRGKAVSRGITLDDGEALHDKDRSTRVTKDGANVFHNKSMPRGYALEGAEEFCGNQQQGRPDDAAAARVGERAAESSSEGGSASISELKKLQERLRAACFSNGKVSDLAAVAAKLPVAGRGKLGHHPLSSSSLSTMALDVGSDSDAETPRTAASNMRMRKVFSSGSINSMASTTASHDSPLIAMARSPGSFASTDDLDLRELQLQAETEPDQFEFEMSIEEIDGHGWATSPGPGPAAVEVPSPPEEPAVARAAARAAFPPRSPPPAETASPRCLNLAERLERTRIDSDGVPFTTLMVRNIPYHYTQRELIAELEDLGLAGTFDFVYLPAVLETMANVGYAFVNFTDMSLARSALELIPNHKFRLHQGAGSGKPAFVSVARIQGLEKNMKNYNNVAMKVPRMKEHRPVIIANISNTLGAES